MGQGGELAYSVLRRHARTYMDLKALRWDYLADQVGNWMIDRPEFANHLLGSLSSITNQLLQGD